MPYGISGESGEHSLEWTTFMSGLDIKAMGPTMHRSDTLRCCTAPVVEGENPWASLCTTPLASVEDLAEGDPDKANEKDWAAFLKLSEPSKMELDSFRVHYPLDDQASYLLVKTFGACQPFLCRHWQTSHAIAAAKQLLAVRCEPDGVT